MKVVALFRYRLFIWFLLVSIVGVGFLTVQMSAAQVIPRSDASVSDSFITLSADLVRPDVRDNAYIITQNVLVDTSTVGDIHALGDTITIVAPLVGDISFLGTTAHIFDHVSGDVRAIADYVTVEGEVTGEIVHIGDSFIIGKEGIVRDGLGVIAEQVELQGTILGDVWLEAKEVNIFGTVQGTVHAKHVSNITLYPGSRVIGDILHSDHVGALTILDGAVLEGSQEAFSVQIEESMAQSLFFTLIFFGIIGYLTFIIPRRRWNTFVHVPIQEGVLAVIVGLLILLLGSAFMLALLFFSFFIPGFILISLALFFALLLLLLLGVIVVPLFAGAIVQFVYTKDMQITWQTVIVGSVVITLITLVPHALFVTVLLSMFFLTGRLGCLFFKNFLKK